MLQAPFAVAHGSHRRVAAVRASLSSPRLAAASSALARPDQAASNAHDASEFVDDDASLRAKIAVVADLVRASRYTVVYSGAGLSRAAGIADYATKAANSVAATTPELRDPTRALPTFAHRAIVALHAADLVHYQVNQNHDCLSEKAGLPQRVVNEIHGSWFDPSNPVVQFDENLRGDLFDAMLDAERRADLCLCVGTSLSGMNADRVANSPARRLEKHGKGHGTVLVNLQRTPLDGRASVRIWAPIDTVMRMLVDALGVDVADAPTTPLPLTPMSHDTPHEFLVPYDARTGTKLDVDGDDANADWCVLDLRKGQRIRIAVPEASNYDCNGVVEACNADGHYSVIVTRPNKRPGRYMLGRWWIADALSGEAPRLPFVNVDARSAPNPTSATSSTSTARPRAPPPTRKPSSRVIKLVQGHHERTAGDGASSSNTHEWTLKLVGEDLSNVTSVTYDLHETFSPPTVTVTKAPFEIRRTGWGTFDVGVVVRFRSTDDTVELTHPLQFDLGDGDRIVSQKVSA